MIKYIIVGIISLPVIAFIFAPFYFKFGFMKWLFHDIYGWHEPDGKYTYKGCTVHSHCKFCGEEIMQDGQGNWF